MALGDSMEGSMVAGEKCCSSKNITASKSMESPILIDSISINLMNSNEGDAATNCEHFSIRGYVTQIRKRDWTLCWPFASDEDNNKSEEQKSLLPPLFVKKFKFWRCHNCLGEVDAQGTANAFEVLNSCHNSFNIDNSCSHVPVAADVALCLSQQVSQIDNIGDEGKKIHGSSSDNLSNTIKNQPSECITEKKKELELPRGAIIGDNVQLEINLNQEAASSMMQKTCYADELAVTFMGKYDGSISLPKPFCHHHDVADSESSGGLDYVARSSAKNFERAREDGNCKEPLSANMDCADRSTSLQSEQHDDASSESAEMVGNNLKDLYHEDSSSLRRRKARKVRLLTELLTENGDGDNDIVRTTNDSVSNDTLNPIPDASAKVNVFAVTQGQLIVQGQARSVLDHSRKRKISQDEDWKPAVTSSPNKVVKEVRASKGDSEIVGSELQADVCATTGVKNDLKRHMGKQRLDKGPTAGKRKNKKLNFSEKKISLPVSDDHVPNATAEKLGDDSNCIAVDVALSKLENDALPSREMDLFPFPAQTMERRPSFSNKKKGKMPEIDDHHTSAWNGGIFGEDIMTTKNIGIIHSVPFGVPFHSAEDISQERGLELSLNSYVPIEGHDRKYITQVENRKSPFFVWHGGISEDQVMRKAPETKHCQNFGFTSMSGANAPTRKGLDVSLSSNGSNFIMPFLNQKHNLSSQIEFGACSLMQQKDYFTPNNNKKTTGNQDHLNIQRADKVPEQGVLDDIPMDIVELMAKNQYERCLPDSEYQNSQLATTDYPRGGQTIDFSKVYGKEGMSLFPQEFALKGNPRAKNGRNRTIKREEITGLAKPKSIDFYSHTDRNQLNMNELEQTQLLAGLGAAHQENPSNVDQNCVSSSPTQSSGPNSASIGNVNAKRFSHPILHGSRSCDTCQWNLEQNEEANRLWQSMLPNNMPFVYRIPPKSGGPSANLTMLSCTAGPGSMHQEKTNGPHELKFVQCAANIGKQIQNVDSEPLTRTHSGYLFPCKHSKIQLNEKLVGSLDLYSNETIPAMHLLSLVDAGARSSAQVDKDISSELLKRPMKSDHGPKQFPGQESSVYKPPNAVTYNPYNYHGKSQFADCPHGQVPAMPITVGASSASPQHDKSFKKGSEYISQEKHKRKFSDFQSQSKSRSRKSASSGSFGTNCGSVPAHSLHRVFFGTPESRVFPSQIHACGNSAKHKIPPLNNSGIARPSKSSAVTQICSLNRNPADFSIPDEGNEFMIKGEELKSVEEIPLKNGFHLNSLNGPKRQRKIPAIKAGM